MGGDHQQLGSPYDSSLLSFQCNQSVLRASVNSTGTACRLPPQRDTLSWEYTYLSVTPVESTRLNRYVFYKKKDIWCTLLLFFAKSDFFIIIFFLQCHSSSGHCWCVDSRGQERAGTKTPPGAPAVDCDRPGLHYNLFCFDFFLGESGQGFSKQSDCKFAHPGPFGVMLHSREPEECCRGENK